MDRFGFNALPIMLFSCEEDEVPILNLDFSYREFLSVLAILPMACSII